MKVSSDLTQAVVYWSGFGMDEAQRKETAEGLKAATGYIKRELGQALKLRVMPDIRFVYDEAIDRGARIEQLLREIHAEDAAREEQGPPSDGREGKDR